MYGVRGNADQARRRVSPFRPPRAAPRVELVGRLNLQPCSDTFQCRGGSFNTLPSRLRTQSQPLSRWLVGSLRCGLPLHICDRVAGFCRPRHGSFSRTTRSGSALWSLSDLGSPGRRPALLSARLGHSSLGRDSLSATSWVTMPPRSAKKRPLTAAANAGITLRHRYRANALSVGTLSRRRGATSLRANPRGLRMCAGRYRRAASTNGLDRTRWSDGSLRFDVDDAVSSSTSWT